MTHSPSTREPARLFLHLLPCFLLAVVCTVLFWWQPFGQPPTHAYFNVLVASDQPGTVIFHYDVDSAGLKAGRAGPVRVPGGRVPTQVRFAMPAGKLNAVHLNPRAEQGTAYLLRCWITNESGGLIVTLPPALIAEANPGFADILPNAILRFQSQPQADNNGLFFRPEPAIELATAPRPPLWQMGLVFVAALGVSLGLSLFLGERALAVLWIVRVRTWMQARPARALFCAAVFSVSLSCFPVIFCGKSFVSPDNGLLMFYDKNPTVPGAVGGRVDNALASDLGATLYWGLPVTMTQHRALFRDHEFPLWNRYNWGGLTLFGQSLSAIGDPLSWPAILTGGAAWAWDAKFIVAQVLLAFGVGLMVWRTSGSLAAAMLLNLSAPFMGFFAYRYNHPAIFSLCYAPWILLAWIEGVRAPTLRGSAVWAFLLILADWWQLNSGTAKEMSALLLFTNIAGGLMVVFAVQPLKWRVARLGVFAWANILFLLVSAPLWMTFLDALGKAHTSYDEPRIYQIEPQIAVGLFDDLFYRQFMRMEALFNPSANFFILLGVLWALVLARTLIHERTLWAVGVPALLAAALAFGVIPPAAAATVPFLKSISHFDNTFSCVLIILSFVIAGYGLRECVGRMESIQWRGDWALVLAFLGILIATYFGTTEAAHRTGLSMLKVGETIPKSPFFVGYVVALLTAFAILPWAWRQLWLRRPAAAAWAGVFALAFVTLHFRHGMYGETKFDYYTRNPKKRLDLRHVTSPAIETVRHSMAEPARVIGLDWEMVPGFNAVLGLETISGPDALMNPQMMQLVDVLGIPRIWDWRVQVKAEDFASVHRALDMLNVRYIFDSPDAGGRALPGTKVLNAADLTVLESETAWPRAFFTDAVAACDAGGDFRRLVFEGDGRPFAALPAAWRARLKLPPKDFAQRLVQPAKNYRLTTNSTAFEIDAPTPGVAVLLETNSTNDIVASVDDQPALCLAMNHAFRGVFVSTPGRHVIKFEYWPAVLDRALNLALFGLIALAVSFWWWWRAGRRMPLVSATEAVAAAPATAS
jgi:hypothetical protein